MSGIHDVAILGAGAAGSTLALLLARAGWNVALVDKDVFPRRKVCGECIAAGNLELLENLGLGPAFSSMAGAELRSMELWSGPRRVRADLPPAPGAHPWGRALGREHLDALLLDAARRAGAEVLQPWVARGVHRIAADALADAGRGGARQLADDAEALDDREAVRGTRDAASEPDEARVAQALADADAVDSQAAANSGRAGHRADRSIEHIAQREPWAVALSTSGGGTAVLQAHCVVLANGSWGKPLLCSSGRKQEHRARDLFAFKANFQDVRLSAGVLPVFAFPGGYGGMVIAEHGRATLAFCVRRDVLGRLRKRYAGLSAAEAVAQNLVETCAGLEDVLQGSRLDGPWLAAGPIRPGVRVGDRGPSSVFQVGNAAGEAHPIIGEGISMALQGAALLSRHLLAGGPRRDAQAWHAAATAYAREWRQNFAGRIRMATMCAHAAMRPALAPMLFPLLQRHPALLTSGARLAAKARAPLLPTPTWTTPRAAECGRRSPHPIEQKEPV